jgi:exodeoxyribonuclease V alpha subunit
LNYGNLAIKLDEYENVDIVDVLENKQIGDEIKIRGKFKTPPRYYDENNSYCVCAFNATCLIEDDREIELIVTYPITVTGYYSFPDPKNEYIVTGKVNIYKKEKQLILENMKFIEPTTIKGIYSFLASGIIKGVGPKTAEKIVYGYTKNKMKIEGFGLNALDVIRNNPERLKKIPGISDKRASKIHNSFMTNIELNDVMMFFSQYDISPVRAMKIYKTFGAFSIPTVKANPFNLLKIDGFGFDTCDKIARRLGSSPHNEDRISEGILYTLTKAAQDGHCYLPENELIEKAGTILNIELPIARAKAALENKTGNNIEIQIDGLKYSFDRNDFENRVNETEELGKNSKIPLQVPIDAIKYPEIKSALANLEKRYKIKKVNNNSKIYIYKQSIYEKEQELSESILNILQNKVPNVPIQLIMKFINDYETEHDIKLEEKQVEAITTGINNRLFIVTGPAGSGKSTVINCYLYICEKLFNGFNIDTVAQSAPTGKAAKRITEVTGVEARTIHRLLEYRPPHEYGYNRANKLSYKLIIVDEASMLDLSLAYQLFIAIDPRNTRIALIGDIEQLPSIGEGNILKDMIDSNVVPVIRLDVVKRQAVDSDIIKNATNVIDGKMIVSDADRGQFVIAEEKDPERIANRMLLCLQYYLNTYSIDNIQVLCPQKKGIIGTVSMNERIQKLVNPPSHNKREMRIGYFTFRTGDKVFHNKNNYEIEKYNYINDKYEVIVDDNFEPVQGVFNGETGIIAEIIDLYDEEEEDTFTKIAVKYDDCYVLYGAEEWEQLEPAYSLTVHKYQGSQNKVIIIPISFHNYKLLSRNLLYTAITRAEDIVVIIGDPRAMHYSIKNVILINRNTMLKELLQGKTI